MSPFFAFEAQQPITFKLFNKRVCLVLLIEFRLGGENLPNKVRIGDGETNGRAEPHEKCCTYDQPQLLLCQKRKEKIKV